MHYIFVDESYPKSGEKRIVIAAWAVEQGRFNAGFNSIGELQKSGKSSILQRIDLALARLSAVAVIGEGALAPDIIRSGEIDRCDDIPEMARMDNAWSMAVMFVVARVVRNITVMQRNVDAIDLLYDPKSLKSAHETAWMSATKNLIGKGIQSLTKELGIDVAREGRIRDIRPIAKPAAGASFNKFQCGTWLADRLCGLQGQGQIDSVSLSSIKVMDISEVVTRTVQQWDGVPIIETVGPRRMWTPGTGTRSR